MKRLSPDERKQYMLLCGAAILFIALIGLITALCMPFFSKLSEPVFQAQFQEWINSLGFGGWLVVLGIQIFQIIVAFIPGEPVELIAGVIWRMGRPSHLFTRNRDCFISHLFYDAPLRKASCGTYIRTEKS